MMKTSYKLRIFSSLLVLLALTASPLMQADTKSQAVVKKDVQSVKPGLSTSLLKPPTDLSVLVGILQADLNKNQNQNVEIKVSRKFSTKKIKPIKTLQLSYASADKGLSLKPTQEKPVPLLDSKFSLLLKFFLSDIKIFNTLFAKVTELRVTKGLDDPQGLTARKIGLKLKDDFFGVKFGIKSIVASLDKGNHLRAVEITDSSGIKIYELSQKSAPAPSPPQQGTTQNKTQSTPLKPNLVW
jgi:hypothetical protein